VFGVVDFDVVTTDTLDLALKEAEVLKVLDEVVVELPPMSASPMCFMLGHSDLLQLIFDFCGIPHEKRKKTADIISRLNVHGFTWSKARSELRAANPGLANTSVDELKRFDFRGRFIYSA
jgi:translation initiation factor 2-alpha kinase 4